MPSAEGATAQGPRSGREGCLRESYNRFISVQLLQSQKEISSGADHTFRDSIHSELGGIWADCLLVCSAAPVQAATRGSPGAIAVGPCLSHCRWYDPGSRLC